MESLERWAKLAYHKTLDFLTGWATRNPERAARVLLVCGVIFALLVLVFAVVGCAPVAERPLKQDFERARIVLHVTVHPADRIGTVCAGLQDLPGRPGAACARWHPTEGYGEIHIVEPRHQEDWCAFANIGHELWHVLRGRFHDPDSKWCRL